MIGRKVAWAASLLSLVQVMVRFFDLIMALIVANVVTPDAFGLVSIGLVTLMMARAFTELPVGDALIQMDHVGRRELDTAFTMTLMRDWLVAAFVVLIAAPLSWLYDAPGLAPILWVLALVPLVTSFGSPGVVLLARQVNYTPITAARAVARTIGFVIGASGAWIAQSYWPLLLAMVVSAALETAFTYIIAPHLPRLNLARFRDVLSFAGWMSLSRIAITITAEADRFIIPAVLGKAITGFFYLGTNIANSATWAFASYMMTPLFAGLTQFKNDLKRIAAAYSKGQQVIVALILPVGFGLALVADPLVAWLLGEEWSAVALIIVWIAPAISFQMMVLAVHSVSLALGKPRGIFLRDAFVCAVTIPTSAIAIINFGLAGAIAVRVASAVLWVMINLFMAKSLLGIGVLAQFRNCWRSFVSAAAMVCAVLFLRDALPFSTDGWRPFVLMAVYIGGGAATYYAVHGALWLSARRPAGVESFVLDSAGAVLARLGLRRSTG